MFAGEAAANPARLENIAVAEMVRCLWPTLMHVWVAKKNRTPNALLQLLYTRQASISAALDLMESSSNEEDTLDTCCYSIYYKILINNSAAHTQCVTHYSNCWPGKLKQKLTINWPSCFPGPK